MARPLILLVDTYASSRRALADLLLDSGYAVSQAESGAEGVRVAAENRPELIIADPFPDFSVSLRMLELLRGDRATRSIPLLVVTSLIPQTRSDRLPRLGFAGYLQKPCAPELVLSEVRRILNGEAPGSYGTLAYPLHLVASA